MDNKAWLWRKKSTEKTIFDADNVNFSLKWNEEEIQTLLSDKEKLEKDLKNLTDKLTSALSELNAKDELVKKHAKIAQDAIASLEKAEAESISLKQELDEALHQRVVGEERVSHLDAALKECMQQLRFVREDKEQRIHDAMMKTSKECENSKMVLEEKLAETSKRLAKIGVKNSHLSKALLVKEQLIEDVNKQKMQMEKDLNSVMGRLDSIERDNASLKYEVRVLEKELEIRNEEREFNRRAADATNKQHLESVKKIAKLESECQRLRVLVRKRLPGPAALAKMRNEVEMLGSDSVEMRRRSLNPADNSPETPRKRIHFLTEQLCAMEEENQTLKEALNRKANELQLSLIRQTRTTSKLSQAESQLEELSKVQASLEPPRSSFMSQDLSLASVSDIGSDDKGSCSESWAVALISELEHFRIEKQKGLPSLKTVGASDINLMDDFLEMEKLAIVSVDKPSACSPGPLETETNGNASQVTGLEIVLAPDKVSGLLEDRLKVILDQNRVNQRNPEEILEEIRAALAYTNHPNMCLNVDASESPNLPNDYNSLDSSGAVPDNDILLIEKSNQQLQSDSDLSKSICKIIELIDGISLPSQDYNNPQTLLRKDGTTPTGYFVRVFQWKISEVADVLQQFVQTCYNLLNGKADLSTFSQETASALDWIINHCFSIQDVSSMRDEIQKQFDWDETRSENESEAGMFGHKLSVPPRDQLSCFPSTASSNGHDNLVPGEELKCNMIEENRKLKDELVNTVSSKKDLEVRLQAAISKSESLLNQLRDSERKIASLEVELESLRVSWGKVEEQIENYKFMNGDLDAQLTASRAELTRAYQNFTSLEAELENKTCCYEELEAMCVELQLQLESVKKKENPNENPSYDLDEEEKKLQKGWEISAASEKLAECQHTILNLGKQLKALASPNKAALFDKVISTSTESTNMTTTTTTTDPSKNKSLNRRPSLLDRMIAEDGEVTENRKKSSLPNGNKHKDDDSKVGSWAIVPSKKSTSLWRKLLLRRKRGNGKKASLPIVPHKNH